MIRKDLPSYFFDCDFCDQAFYRQQINYVNFVRDRHLADIYSMLTVNRNGGGGNEFKLFFMGQNKFTGQNDTLIFKSEPNAPEADLREGILGIMKKGLFGPNGIIPKKALQEGCGDRKSVVYGKSFT